MVKATGSSSSGGGIVVDENARKMANLRVLQRMDSSIVDIEGSATHCVLYEFNEDSQAWEKRDVEGSLFVSKRSPDLPRFKLIIMNRNSRTNLNVPITSTFQMQVRDPYLIFRDTDTSTSNNNHNNNTTTADHRRIRGIWFHDGKERQTISNILQRVVKSLSFSSAPTAPTTLLSPLNLETQQQQPQQQQPQPQPVLDKKSLQLSLMSLLQDERFLDLIHAQYLKVAHARANKQQQPPPTKK